ncbi:unnamed protein product [Aphanomyces euteiches]|uniref:CENP-V/GFA domain-containing protein n=1 Tax=Aphanomyces euteiches TaxID=100861 RepID=A0A6G0WIE2_9STRA|nr:hypothetical protein Ae201684_014953 [Aphanomyces euteiches]KAH9076701.1 hypothetical protein Ae201684P_010636 [Aphanomyces euteiches]KAH9142766.1 hypothetical protein AeRB84_013184 [Aphanomyces euteiches]
MVEFMDMEMTGIFQVDMLTQIVVGTSVGILGLVSFALMTISSPAVNTDIGCACGQIKGKLAGTSVLHMVCYCDDCQDLDARLRAKYPNLAPALNAKGGTTVIAAFPSEVTITEGADKLTQVKLMEHTATRRVYASCCGTHMFNATKKSIPFIGIAGSAFRDKNANLGEPQVHIQTKFATSPVPGGFESSSLTFKLKLILRMVLNGSKKNPHPIDTSQPAKVL